MALQDRCQGLALRPPRGGSRAGQDGELVQTESGILDEHRVGELGRLGQGEDLAPEVRQGLGVSPVLAARALEVDRFAADMRALPIRDALRHLSYDRQHAREPSSVPRVKKTAWTRKSTGIVAYEGP